MADLRPPIDAALGAFGVDVTVTVPAGDPVETRAFWLPPITEQYPTGSEYRRAAPKRVMVLPASDVPQAPRGTFILAAEDPGGDVAGWSIDETVRVDHDHHRVVVVSAEIPT